jgi:hypothetical protein
MEINSYNFMKRSSTFHWGIMANKATKQEPKKRWSQKVTESSHALDLERGVFNLKEPKQIAESLKKSAVASKNRKGTPYQSAMSMLNFYINRAGKGLSKERKNALQEAKAELRKAFHKEDK